MNCYACDNSAEQRCLRCGNAYCADHGSNLCATCLDPLNAAPSRNAMWLALVGLLGGSVLALWLLVQPPSVPGEGAPVVRNDASATPALTPQGAGGASPTVGVSATIPAGGTPVVTPTPAATATGGVTAAPTAVPTEAPAGPISYTVGEGDSWNAIASAYGLDAATLAEFNGRVLDDFLQIGETILIPQ